jgi:hypothetical protein
MWIEGQRAKRRGSEDGDGGGGVQRRVEEDPKTVVLELNKSADDVMAGTFICIDGD